VESEKANEHVRRANLVIGRCSSGRIGLADAGDGERLGGGVAGARETARGEALARRGRVWAVSGLWLVHGSDGRSHPPEKIIVDEEMEREG
jgi:hypothetical protein